MVSVRVIAAVTWLLVGCRTAASTEVPEPPAPPATASSSSASASATSTAARTDESGSRSDSEDGLPDTCTIELELLEPTGAQGKSQSDVSGRAAKDDAWAQACAALHKSHGVDCHDTRRVAAIKEASQSIQARRGDGRNQDLYRHEVELGLRKRAKGFGDAPGDRQEACRRAKEHACQELVGGPCPATRQRLITVDGRPPSAAAVEPQPSAPEPPPTI